MNFEQKLIKNNRKIQIGYLIGLFVFSFLWAYVQPLNASPDEGMRYLIPQYIYNHGKLPVGDDPEIMNWVWGSSYGFNPITSYIISALFMKITAFFTTDAFALLMAARMVSMLFGVANAFVVMKIAEKLFLESVLHQWFFIILATFLPQTVFITSYVNIDAMALFSATLTVYMWIVGMESEWSYKSCAALGVSLSCCLLSYYNTYGFLVCSFLLFVISQMKEINKNNWKAKFGQLIKKGLVVLAVVAVCAGWWFIRNYMLYDGDILGMKAINECAEQYAIWDMKPSNVQTYAKQGISVWRMLFVDGWLYSTANSFIACFGFSSIYVAVWMYIAVGVIVLVGIVGVVVGKPLRHKENSQDNIRGSFLVRWMMAVAVFLTIAISVYYSYTSDYQPQGRYCMPMLTCLMYLVVYGYQKIGSRMAETIQKIQTVVLLSIMVIFIWITVQSYFGYFLPSYSLQEGCYGKIINYCTCIL